ncbi:Arb2 domain-containing protein [Rostrohypoxylon terebratum]|nr:Arb2 domain-containing protein [Rostrohypoxylon terebratum]
MFRRKWVGLPEDPSFPIDLKELGYFINEVDEVRAIDNPNNYFKYFINRNPRWNDRQRFSMNLALQDVIWKRLKGLGMEMQHLPLTSSDPTQPRVPIFLSKDVGTASRVVVVIGETDQDLGVLAHRVIGGPGGVNKGSMVSIVSALQEQSCSATDMRSPGIILANTGELIWWPEEHRTLSLSAWHATPMKSAVHRGNRITPANYAEGNESAKAHVAYIFEHVIPRFVDKDAKIDVLSVGDGADLAVKYLDTLLMRDEWKNRIGCLALVGGLVSAEDLQNEEFKKGFLRHRTRAYATCKDPAGLVISGPDGNPNTRTYTEQGCPVFSSGSEYYMETTLITAREVVLDWMQEVAMTPEGEEYMNPKFQVLYYDQKMAEPPEPDWSQWKRDDSETNPEDVGGQVEMMPEMKFEEDGTESAKEGKSGAAGLILATRPDAE